MANAPRLAGVSDESLRLREQQLLVRLARQFHVDENTLRARLRELRKPTRRATAKPAPARQVARTAADRTGAVRDPVVAPGAGGPGPGVRSNRLN